MSENTKKSLVILALSQPGGSERSNPDLAKEVGCDAKFVRSVRAEIESEQLMLDNIRLEAENNTLKAELAESESSCGFFERRVSQLTNERDLLWKNLGEAGEKLLAAQGTPVATPAPKPRKRKPKNEFYPLFETV